MTEDWEGQKQIIARVVVKLYWPVSDDSLQTDVVVSEAVEGEPSELGCQLADQAGELNTELLSHDSESGKKIWRVSKKAR